MLASVLLFSGRRSTAYALQDERLLGLSPLTDQRLAGAVMMAEQIAALGHVRGVPPPRGGPGARARRRRRPARDVARLGSDAVSDVVHVRAALSRSRRRRGVGSTGARGATSAPRWRAVLFGAGLFLLAASLNSPLETLAAHYLLLIHLFQNVVIADWRRSSSCSD